MRLALLGWRLLCPVLRLALFDLQLHSGLSDSALRHLCGDIEQQVLACR